jgi:2-iminobutanoate/2-iminopropanoate deaminase
VVAAGLVFVSSQTGIDFSTGHVPHGPFELECRQAFRNLDGVLRAADSELADIVQTTVYHTDPADLPIINAVYAEIFAADRRPARSAVQVGLAAGRRIGIAAIAAHRR